MALLADQLSGHIYGVISLPLFISLLYPPLQEYSELICIQFVMSGITELQDLMNSSTQEIPPILDLQLRDQWIIFGSSQ